MKKRNTIVRAYSIRPELDGEMEEMLRQTGMTRTQFITASILWAKNNPTHLNGLVTALRNEAGERWLTANNVGYDEKDPLRATDPEDVSSNTYQNTTKEELDRLVAIAKYDYWGSVL